MARLLTAKQAAEYLTLSADTVYRLARQHEITFVKIGASVRFTYEDLDAWIKENTVHAQESTPRPIVQQKTTHQVSTVAAKQSRVNLYPPPVRPGYTPITPVPCDL